MQLRVALYAPASHCREQLFLGVLQPFVAESASVFTTLRIEVLPGFYGQSQGKAECLYLLQASSTGWMSSWGSQQGLWSSTTSGGV